MDTDLIVAAMRSPSGASAAIVRSARRDKAALLLTVALALEYEAVCQRAEHRLAAGLRERQAESIFAAWIAMAHPVEKQFLWRPQLRDPNAEMVLETAGNARGTVSGTFTVRNCGR